MKKILTAIALLFMSVNVNAATFEVKKEDGLEILYIQGTIDKDDSVEFITTIFKYPKLAVVDLNSDGGIVVEGMVMAEFINRRQVTTRVRSGNRCFSICSVLFLSGKKKFMHEDAYLGVHTAFDPSTKKRDDYVNSYIAWYFGYLGYNMGLVKMWLETDPSSVNFITGKINQELGLGIETLQ